MSSPASRWGGGQHGGLAGSRLQAGALGRRGRQERVRGGLASVPTCLPACRLSPPSLPPQVQHYSGNMWWASCRYVRSLPDPRTLTSPAQQNRYLAEAWIGMGPDGWRPLSCFRTAAYYERRVPRAYYEHHIGCGWDVPLRPEEEEAVRRAARERRNQTDGLVSSRATTPS